MTNNSILRGKEINMTEKNQKTGFNGLRSLELEASKIIREKGLDPELLRKSIEMTPQQKAQLEEQQAIAFTKKFKKSKKRNIWNNSVYSQREEIQSTFDDMDTNTPDDKEMVVWGKNVASRIVSERKAENYILNGKPGRGKTMTAVSIANAILKSDTDITCYFLNTAQYLLLSKRSIKDDRMRDMFYNAENLAKSANVLIIDDLGSEADMTSDVTSAKPYVQETIYRLANARVGKVNIITTNNTGSELRSIYNSKTISRLISSPKKNVFIATGKDHRKDYF